MADAQLANQRAFAIPREIRAEIRERHLFVHERPKSSVPDDARPKLLGAEVYRTGDFDKRGRTEFRVCKRFSPAESIKECFQIKAALNLEFGGVALPIPIAAAGDAAPAVAPLTVRDVQSLVIPFCCSGEIPNFVAVALQSVPAQRRLDSGLFDFRDVSAELHLQRRMPPGEPELLQLIHHPLRNQNSPLPFFRRDRWRRLIILSFDQLPPG